MIERTVDINDSPCRIWEKGEGDRVGFLAGFRGTPRWTPFLERLSEKRRVIVPSLPGFPGAGTGHQVLDDTPDWIAMTLDLLEAAGLDGADLIGESIGGMLAAEVAALSRASVRRLVLMAPLGLYDAREPVRNPFQTHRPNIPSLLTSSADAYTAAFGPHSEDAAIMTEHELTLLRADEAAARLIWPFGERGLVKRLHRIAAPTLLLWGTEDQIVPPSYAQRFADGIRSATRIETVIGAGHLASIDAPKEAAEAVLSFFSA